MVNNPFRCLQSSGPNANQQKVTEKVTDLESTQEDFREHTSCSQFKDQLHALHITAFQAK